MQPACRARLGIRINRIRLVYLRATVCETLLTNLKTTSMISLVRIAVGASSTNFVIRWVLDGTLQLVQMYCALAPCVSISVACMMLCMAAV